MRVLLAVVGLVLMGSTAIAAGPAVNETRMGDSAETAAQQGATSAEPWKAWNLTEKEWRRYQQLMSGPRGTWTPDASPIMVLGLNARSDQERTRYARKAARMDWKRLMRERDWFLTYQKAKGSIFGERIDALNLEAISIDGVSADSELVLFTNQRCQQVCRKTLNVVIEQKAQLDVYFVGSDINRQDIVRWAREQKLPLELVNDSRRITLNRDKGLFAALSQSASADLPRTFIRDPRQDGRLVEVRF